MVDVQGLKCNMKKQAEVQCPQARLFNLGCSRGQNTGSRLRQTMQIENRQNQLKWHTGGNLQGTQESLHMKVTKRTGNGQGAHAASKYTGFGHTSERN